MTHCIYINTQPNGTILNCALEYFQDHEIFFVVDSTNYEINKDLNDYALINVYHIINKKYDGNIVFTNINDFTIRSTDLKNKNKVLITRKEDLVKLDKNILDDKTNFLIFEPTKKNIRKAKNAELQSILR